MAAAVEFDTRTLKAKDGLALHLHRWRVAHGEAKAWLLIVPGYAEHGGRYEELAHRLVARGVSTLALDLRGHGKSAGRRGYVARFSEYLDDVEVALSTIGGAKRFLLGHSQGGLVALDFVAARNPVLAGLIVTNPFLGLALEVPALKLLLGRVAARLLPTLTLPSGLDPAGVSHDSRIVEAYRRDPLVFRTATAGWFREVTAAQERVRALREVTLPLLYIHSDADPIASPEAAAALAAQLTAPDKTVWLRPGELHEVLNETGRAKLHEQIADWVVARAAS